MLSARKDRPLIHSCVVQLLYFESKYKNSNFEIKLNLIKLFALFWDPNQIIIYLGLQSN